MKREPMETFVSEKTDGWYVFDPNRPLGSDYASDWRGGVGPFSLELAESIKDARYWAHWYHWLAGTIMAAAVEGDGPIREALYEWLEQQ